MKVLQQSTYYDDGRPRKLYAVICRDHATGAWEVMELTDDKRLATGAYGGSDLATWMKSQAEAWNACPRLENGEAGIFYALRYRRPANMKRVECCRCGKRFYAYIDQSNPQYDNRVCPTCAKKER